MTTDIRLDHHRHLLAPRRCFPRGKLANQIPRRNSDPRCLAWLRRRPRHQHSVDNIGLYVLISHLVALIILTNLFQQPRYHPCTLYNPEILATCKARDCYIRVL